MKVQRKLFKWMGMTFLFTLFISFTFLLPSAFAQEENPETETPISAEATPEPLEIPEIESESSFQSFSLQSTTELGGDWAAQVNLSVTVGESFKPQIAADNNGYLSLWIDGTLVGTIANVDNDLWTLDFVQLGATAGIDSTTSGSMLFDNFVSRRFTYIGQ